MTARRALHLTLDVASVVVCVVGACLPLLDDRGTGTMILLLVALSGGTGWAVATWLKIAELSLLVSVTFGIGVAVTMLVGLIFVDIRVWSPDDIVAGLLLAAGLSSAVHLGGSLARRAAQ